MLIYRNGLLIIITFWNNNIQVYRYDVDLPKGLLIIYKQNGLKSQENVNTVIQLLSMDLKVRFDHLLKVRFGYSTAFNWSPIPFFFN